MGANSNELQVNEPSHIEATMSRECMVFQAWAKNSQWLVLRIGGAVFIHCWVAERAESLITKQ